MSRQNTIGFDGFSPGTLRFLQDAANKNSRIWFEEHREDYRRLLLDPMRKLVSALAVTMHDIDPEFELRPAVNKTISRIFRDIRFSRDKSLFRSNMWITFKRPLKNWQDFPGYYFEISHDSYSYGMGYYSASRLTMDTFRDYLLRRPEEFRKRVSFLEKSPFVLMGDKYKRQLRPEPDADLEDWFQRKSFYLACSNNVDEILFSNELVAVLQKGFRSLGPLYSFLCGLRSRVSDYYR